LRENILFNQNTHTNPCHSLINCFFSQLDTYFWCFIWDSNRRHLSTCLKTAKHKFTTQSAKKLRLRVKLGGRNNPSIQRNCRSINLFSIQECIFGIRRIQAKLRSIVWTVHPPGAWAFHGGCIVCILHTYLGILDGRLPMIQVGSLRECRCPWVYIVHTGDLPSVLIVIQMGTTISALCFLELFLKLFTEQAIFIVDGIFNHSL
jgi:hypothetical protein